MSTQRAFRSSTSNELSVASPAFEICSATALLRPRLFPTYVVRATSPSAWPPTQLKISPRHRQDHCPIVQTRPAASVPGTGRRGARRRVRAAQGGTLQSQRRFRKELGADPRASLDAAPGAYKLTTRQASSHSRTSKLSSSTRCMGR